MPEHGGNLTLAVERFGIPSERWIDLSTGINPESFPFSPLNATDWRTLPHAESELLTAARAYYNATSILAVAGSQAAIQLLPRLRSKSRVAFLPLSYNEHSYNWRKRGHECVAVSKEQLIADCSSFDVVVICNPNNPTGEKFAPEVLLELHANLSQRSGWLVVDEAFMDCTPSSSVVSSTGDTREGLIVLRSFGKFFGLAGVRLGFVAAWSELLEEMRSELGPWTVNGPALKIACEALRATEWHSIARTRLTVTSSRLKELLCDFDLTPTGGTAFFQWIETPRARRLHEHIAAGGILTRLFEPVETARMSPSIRFGLPGSEEEFNRLQTRLRSFEIGLF